MEYSGWCYNQDEESERKQYIWSGMQCSEWVTTQSKEICAMLFLDIPLIS